MSINKKKEMSIEIKNNRSEEIKLFVRINGVEKQVDILPGNSILADEYETRIMKIYKRKGLISIIDLKGSLEPEKQVISTETVVESKAPKQASRDDARLVFDKLKAGDVIKNVETLDKAPDADKLQIVDTEAEQYIEDGFIKGEWSEDEVKFLTREYPKNGRKYCATNLNRNETSVQKKVNSLGLRKRKKRKK